MEFVLKRLALQARSIANAYTIGSPQCSWTLGQECVIRTFNQAEEFANIYSDLTSQRIMKGSVPSSGENSSSASTK